MIAHRYDAEANRLHLTITGILKSREISDYFSAVLGTEGLRPGFLEIVDLNQATDLELRLSDMKRLQELSMAMIASGHEATFALAYTPLSQAMLPFMQPLFQHVDLNIHVFRDAFEFEEAMEAVPQR